MGTWHLLLRDGSEITGQEQRLDTFYPYWRSLPEFVRPRRQWIVTSVWICRGLWYFRVHAVDQQQLLEIAPHHKGHRSQAKVLGMVAAGVELLKRKHPQAACFPVVHEGSPEYRRLLSDAA
jgi:hypothetical protein